MRNLLRLSWMPLAGAALLSMPIVLSLEAPAAAPEPSSSTHAREHTPVDEGGGFDLRPRLVQASHFSGTTRAETRPQVRFRGRHIASPEAVAARLQELASFSDEQGHTVGVEVAVQPSRMPTYSH